MFTCRVRSDLHDRFSTNVMLSRCLFDWFLIAIICKGNLTGCGSCSGSGGSGGVGLGSAGLIVHNFKSTTNVGNLEKSNIN